MQIDECLKQELKAAPDLTGSSAGSLEIDDDAVCRVGTGGGFARGLIASEVDG